MSIVRVSPSSATRTAASKADGIPCVRPKSCPVPLGRTAISATTPAAPLTTSFTVPSPPTTTRRRSPASRAACARCPGNSESTSSPLRPSSAARRRRSGQRLPVAPFPEAGLTRNSGSLIAGDGRERDAGHPVDGRAQLLVGDPREHALDDDVRDGEEAAGLDARRLPDTADRRDGEECGRLHLDAEDAAARPALVLPLVRVVEDVARDDRADVHRLAHLLRHVNGLVDEIPGSGRAMRLAAD